VDQDFTQYDTGSLFGLAEFAVRWLLKQIRTFVESTLFTVLITIFQFRAGHSLTKYVQSFVLILSLYACALASLGADNCRAVVTYSGMVLKQSCINVSQLV
jgi:hypothetical protein